MISKPKFRSKKAKEPVWTGPCNNGSRGGISQSLLNSFLCCRERFRVKVIDGLCPEGGFEVKTEFGNAWHICEEHHANNKDWESHLKDYFKQLVMEYPLEQKEINKWYRVIKLFFPVYINWWKKHPDMDKRVRKPIAQEKTFHIPYKLPDSGRTIYLRGKWDSVDKLLSGIDKGVWLQENKTHTELKDERIEKRLRFDLQTDLYIVALESDKTALPKGTKIRGVRYNCIRRPLSGGKDSIRQKKNQTENEFYQELQERIEAAHDGEEHEFFRRWNVLISQDDLERFKVRLLNPILENLINWYEWVTGGDPWRKGNKLHWQLPYGLYNPMLERGGSDVDEYVDTGNEVGLTRVDSLFGELE